MEVHGKRSPLNFLNKSLVKYLRKTSFLVRLQVLKMNSLTQFFKLLAKCLGNVVHDFWENCFRKPKPLIAAIRLISLNIAISKIHGPRHLCVPYFFT